ncbi:MAG TPA: DMT family transporter [Candidatus Udaeobacter sp.]|nr:DMT family transporter [Candidatus Udaeobacter sp.]
MLAITFGVLASVCFAAASLLAQRGLYIAPTPWGAWVTLVANTVFLLLFHVLLYPHAPIFISENLVFVVVGLFVPGLTRVLTFRGIQAMGSAVTSTIVNTTPMFSTILAMLILGERPGPLVLFGVVAIVGGLVIISWEGPQRSWKKIELLFPFLAAVLFSMKDVTVRWGLGGNASPVLAAGIAAGTSTVEIFLINRYVYRQKFLLPTRNVIHWFVSSGICTGGSFLFMFVALSMERVSIIAPLINSYAVFVLILTPLIARHIEKVTGRKAAGAALVVLGIFLISLGRD